MIASDLEFQKKDTKLHAMTVMQRTTPKYNLYKIDKSNDNTLDGSL